MVDDYSYNYYFNDINIQNSPQFIKVPDIWNSYIPSKSYGKGFGTYHLKVKLPKSNQKYGILIKNSGTSYKVFVDSILIGQVGEPSENKQNSYCKL